MLPAHMIYRFSYTLLVCDDLIEREERREQRRQARALQLAQQQLAEQRRTEQQLSEQRRTEQRLSEQRLSEPRRTEPRLSQGAYPALYARLRQHEDRFQRYFRMKVSSFDDLLLRVEDAEQGPDANVRHSSPPAERLMVTLRFLATGQSYSSLHLQFRMEKSSISKIVADTTKVLWKQLQPVFLPVPTTQTWMDAAALYWEKTQFPNCIGALDAKHIQHQKHPPSRFFFSDEPYFSIVLIAIANADYSFLIANFGAFGHTNESHVFKESKMGRRMYSGSFRIPPPRPFPGTAGPPMPYVLVADEAFQMCPNLIKPYSSHDLNHCKKIFNYRLSRARRMVECAFGILVTKWRIFESPTQLKRDTVHDVIKACVVLHNFVISKEPVSTEAEDVVPVPAPSHVPRSTAAAARVRDGFSDYFMSSVGSVEGQDRMI